jgi:hypothetical protein
VNFTVYWQSEADRALLAMLFRAADKQQMLRAGRTIENKLRRDPHNAGEGREAGERILFERPLCVFFTIDDDQRKVLIERVKWVGF